MNGAERHLLGAMQRMRCHGCPRKVVAFTFGLIVGVLATVAVLAVVLFWFGLE